MSFSITTSSLLQAAINAIKQGRIEDALWRLDLVLSDVQAAEKVGGNLSDQFVVDLLLVCEGAEPFDEPEGVQDAIDRIRKRLDNKPRTI